MKRGLELTVHDILQWSYARNLIYGSDPKTQYLKMQSEAGELADSILKGDIEGVKDGIGDVVVCLTNIAEQHNLTLSECVEHAYNEIKDRKGIMHNGAFIKESDPEYPRIIIEEGV